MGDTFRGVTPPGRAVSVIIPHYGDPSPTSALARSLVAQAPELEILVVDDCSPVPFPATAGVTVLRRDENGGFGQAVNSGANAATRDLLLILNSDLAVPEDFVEALLTAAEPWLPAVVAPAVVGPDGSPGWTGRRYPRIRHQVTEWLTPLARWRGHPRLHAAVGHDVRAVPGRTAPVDWLVGAVLLMPTAAFHSVGGFDDRFFMNSEEVDLQRRLRALGLPSVHLGSVVVTHAGGGSSDPAHRRRWLVESRRAYADKWGGLRALQLALTGATTVNLVVNLLRFVSGRDVRPAATAREELRLIWR